MKKHYEYLNHAGLELASSFSLAGWVRLDTLGGAQPLASSSNQFVLRVNGDDLELWVDTASVTLTDTVLVATWYYVVATYDAATEQIGLSLNGATPTTVSYTGTLPTGGAFYLGYDGVVDYMDGRLDEWGVWARALTPPEIGKLYNNGDAQSYPFTEPPPPSGSYVAYAPLVICNYNPAADLPPLPNPTPTPTNPYILVDPLDFAGDQTWYDWALQINRIVSPIFLQLYAIQSALDDLSGDLCASNPGMFLRGDDYDQLIEADLGEDPSLQNIVYTLGVTLGRPIGWVRFALTFTQDVGAWYLTALIYFLLAAVSWVIFVMVFMYSIHVARWALEAIIQIWELLPGN